MSNDADVLPAGDRRGTLLAPHGHGEGAASTLGWARGIAPPGWEVEPVSAPDVSDRNHSWFDTGPRGADPVGLVRSLEVLGEAVESHRRSGPVVVVGFSQGAAVALSIPPAEGLAGVIGICGFLPESDVIDPTRGAPALLIGARHDEVTPPFLSGDAATLMSSEGRDVTSITVAGGHEVGDAAVTASRHWLGELTAGGPRLGVGGDSQR